MNKTKKVGSGVHLVGISPDLLSVLRLVHWPADVVAVVALLVVGPSSIEPCSRMDKRMDRRTRRHRYPGELR